VSPDLNLVYVTGFHEYLYEHYDDAEIRKLSFQISSFINISVATHTIIIQESPAPFIIRSTILYNNVAWRNMVHFSGQYFG